MRCLFLFLSFFIAQSLFSQKKGQLLIDSLLTELDKEKIDSNKTKLLSTIALKYSESDPDKAISYSRTGLAIAQKIQFKKAIGQFYLTIGNGYNYKGEYEKALLLLDSSLVVQKEINNQKGIALVQNTIATVYQQQADFPKAADMFFGALKTAEALKDTSLLGRINFNIGAVYAAQNNHEKAMDYHKKAMDFFKNQKAEDLVAIALTSIGSDYINQSQYEQARVYYNQSMQLCKDLGNKRQLAVVYDCFGNLYNQQYKQDSALPYLLSAGELWQQIAPRSQNAIINFGNTGGAYLDIAIKDSLRNLNKNDPAYSRAALLSKAEIFTSKAIDLAKQIGDQVYESMYGKVLADIYEQKGNYKQALMDFRLYTKLDDSIHSQETKNAIAELETKKEVAIRDKEIGLNKMALSTQKRQTIGLIAGLCLLTIIGGLLFWQSRTRKKTNTTLMVLNNQLDDANKVKARFFAILSHDLRSPVANLVNFLHLQKNEPDLLNEQQAAAHQKRITDSAESLLETMEAMLLWSKGQMANFKPDIKSLAVEELFDYISKFFAGTEHVQFTFSNPEKLQVNTDENYLKTIMHNLTANAVKALQQTSNATIDWQAKQENGNIVLSVTDNGPGVNEEQIKALYEETVTANVKTGFGLHIIRDLAKAIRCKVTVQSKYPAGTTFNLAVN